MLFKRRYPPKLSERFRIFIWPRRSWERSLRYVLQRLWRLHGTPHAIAIGCAAGVFISFTPFMGFHFILAGLIAWAIGGSIIASALGTFVGNPLTFPLIWFSTYRFGNWILGEKADFHDNDLSQKFSELSDGLSQSSFETFHSVLNSFWPLVKPMMIGGVPIGIVACMITYGLMKKTVEAYQRRRRKKRSRLEHTT